MTSLLWLGSPNFGDEVLLLVLSIELFPSCLSLSRDGNLSTSAVKKRLLFKKTKHFELTVNLTIGEGVMEPFLQRFELGRENNAPRHLADRRHG